MSRKQPRVVAPKPVLSVMGLFSFGSSAEELYGVVGKDRLVESVEGGVVFVKDNFPTYFTAGDHHKRVVTRDLKRCYRDVL